MPNFIIIPSDDVITTEDGDQIISLSRASIDTSQSLEGFTPGEPVRIGYISLAPGIFTPLEQHVAPTLSGGEITQLDFDLTLTWPVATGNPEPVVSLVSLMRDTTDVTADLIGSVLPNFITGAYVATWQADNVEGTDTISTSGLFTAPAIAPTFTAGPTVTGTLDDGEALTVSYIASGTEPITAEIRWFKDGVVVPGETGAAYSLSTVTSLQTFRAEVSLTNAAGTTGFVASNTLTAPDVGEIIGTPVIIADFADGGTDTLNDVVTWGSFTATVGSVIDPSVKEMQLNSGSWVTFAGDTVTAHPGEWYVRETTTTTAGATRIDIAGPMLVVGEPIVAPVIISHADTTQLTSGTNPAMNVPPVYENGNVLLAIVGQDGGTQALVPTGGWTILSETQIGSNFREGVLTKIADGNDALTMAVSGEIVSAKILALSTGTQITVGTLTAGGTPSPLVYGSSAPTLWLATAIHSGSTTGSQVDDGMPPDGYSFVGNMVQGTTNSSSAAIHVAEKITTADSETPEAFSVATGGDFRSRIIGLRF